MRVRSLGCENPLEEGTATHSSLLAWRILQTEEPGGCSPQSHKERQTQLKCLSMQNKVSLSARKIKMLHCWKRSKKPEWPEGSEQHRKKEAEVREERESPARLSQVSTRKDQWGCLDFSMLYNPFIFFCSLSFLEPLGARWTLAQLPLEFHV